MYRRKWPVSKRVNSSPRAPDDDPTLIERLDEVSAIRANRESVKSKAFRGGNGQIALGTKKHSKLDSHRIAKMRTA
jgi:hypothetical protein